MRTTMMRIVVPSMCSSYCGRVARRLMHFHQHQLCPPSIRSIASHKSTSGLILKRTFFHVGRCVFMDETTTTKLFGWSLSSLIVIMLVLNAISY
jgi:hypothetical protein